MSYYPSSFLNLKQYPVIELKRRERDLCLKDDLRRFARYGASSEADWEGLFEIQNKRKSFRLTTYQPPLLRTPRKRSLLQFLRTPDARDFLPRRHLVALIKLQPGFSHQIIGKKPFFARFSRERVKLPLLFKIRYSLTRVDADRPGPLVPVSFLEMVARVPGLYIEVKDDLMAMEWPQDTGLAGAYGQAYPFCKLCFLFMDRSPELFQT
jgi:hypothetical protein